MGFLNRLKELLSNRWALFPVLAVATVGLVATRLPLAQLPGYELGQILTLALGFAAPLVGIAAARQQREQLTATSTAINGVLRPFFATWVLTIAAVFPPVLVASAGALINSQCDPFATFAFFPLLTLPTAALASAFGVALGFASFARWKAMLGYAALIIAALVIAAVPVLFGPQVFVFSDLFGYVPGPLYDEALSVTASLGWFRLRTLFLTIFVLAFTVALLDPLRGTLKRRSRAIGPALVWGPCLAAVSLLSSLSPLLGTSATYGSVRQALGGHEETPHFTLYYPNGKKRRDVERMKRDLEFRYQQLVDFMGSAPAGKVSVYWYRSADEKNRLVGASRTQFAKPWLREIHINDAPFPHEVLKHELVHAVAAPFGSKPFGVTATWLGLLPHAGVIEGLAVAVDNPVDDLTLHQWAKGMHELKLLPSATEVMSPFGFHAAPSSRAYTAAGSFVRWLGDTQGPDKLRALYAHGDFQAVYGRSVETLGEQWLAFLDTVPLDEGGKQLAYARFRRASIFARPCAREVANLSKVASEQLSSDPKKALETYRRCAQLQPDEPSFQLGQASALDALEQFAEAEAVLQRLSEAVKAYPASAAESLMARVDLAVKTGKLDVAKALLDEIIALRVSPTLDRTARVKRSALESEPVRAAMWRYFTPGNAELKLFILGEAADAAPDHPLLNYLIGRRLAQTGEAPVRARAFLEKALADPTLALSLKRETLKLLVETGFMAADCDRVRELVAHPAWDEAALAVRLDAEEWAARCNFEQRVYGGVLKPPP